MKIIAEENLMQIKNLLNEISDEAYTERPLILSGASIGQHVRHVLEFYLLLISGTYTGTINYDKRERNLELETKPSLAVEVIKKIFKGLNTLNESQQITFESDYTRKGEKKNIITSSVGRELAYCIEHSIHHQALIKAGLIALDLTELTDKYFGVAFSTIRYRNEQCAQ